MTRRILLFDESEKASQLALKLNELGYEVTVHGAREFTGRLAVEQADLIMVRIADFSEVLLQTLSDIRSLPYYPPLLAVIEAEHSAPAARLLEYGCDSLTYLSNDILEVKAWIEALLRRQNMYRNKPAWPAEILQVGGLEINVPERTVRTAAKRTKLTDREMKLLLEFARRPGVICKRAELLMSVWGSMADSLAGTLNTHINRIRMKIEDDYRKPKYLVGVYGVGYRLTADQGEPESANRTEPGAGTSPRRRRTRQMKAQS